MTQRTLLALPALSFCLSGQNVGPAARRSWAELPLRSSSVAPRKIEGSWWFQRVDFLDYYVII